MKARLAIIAVDVSDLPAMAAFYREVLGFTTTFAREGEPWLQLSLGGCDLALKQVPGQAKAARPPFALYLEVDDLTAWLTRLRAMAVPIAEEPRVKEGLYRIAVVLDPEGNRLHLYEMQPPAQRS